MLDFSVLAACITTIALILRTLFDDHPRLFAAVRSMPVAGSVLSCGFCTSLWLAFFAALWDNPLSSWHPPFISFFAGWFSLAAATLLLKGLIVVLIEAGAVLAHRHHSLHEK